MTPQERATALVHELHRQDKITGYAAGAVEAVVSAVEQTVADELMSMAAAFERSAAADWPNDGHAAEHAAFDDGLLVAAGRLRARAAVYRNFRLQETANG